MLFYALDRIGILRFLSFQTLRVSTRPDIPSLSKKLVPVIPSLSRDLYANIVVIFIEILRLRGCAAPLRMTRGECFSAADPCRRLFPPCSAQGDTKGYTPSRREKSHSYQTTPQTKQAPAIRTDGGGSLPYGIVLRNGVFFRSLITPAR